MAKQNKPRAPRVTKCSPSPPVGGFQIYANDPYFSRTAEWVPGEKDASRGAHLGSTYSREINNPARALKMGAALAARVRRLAALEVLSPNN